MKIINKKIILMLLLAIQSMLIFCAHEKLPEKNPFEVYCGFPAVPVEEDSQVLIKYTNDFRDRLHESCPRIKPPRLFLDFCNCGVVDEEALKPIYCDADYYLRIVLRPWAIEARESQLKRQFIWRPSHIAVLGMLMENDILPETISRMIVEYSRELMPKDYGIEDDRIVEVRDGMQNYQVTISPEQSFSSFRQAVAQKAKIAEDDVLLASMWRGYSLMTGMKELVYQSLLLSCGNNLVLTRKYRRVGKEELAEKATARRCLIS